MDTKAYIKLKKERKEIASRLSQLGPKKIEDVERYKEIQMVIRNDPPTLDQQYAALFEG